MKTVFFLHKSWITLENTGKISIDVARKYFVSAYLFCHHRILTCISPGAPEDAIEKRSRDADMLYQDKSDPGVQNTLNQTLGNTVTSALLIYSASFFHHVRIGRFRKKFLL